MNANKPGRPEAAPRRRYRIIAAAAIAMGAVALGAWRASIRCTPPIEGPNAVASLEYVRLGGVDQLLLCRGEDVSKPILLYLRGGPGVPCIPYEHVVRDLEKDFIVVFWDQRGTGRSYPKTIEPVTIDRYVDDAKELVDLLLARFGKERLYLIGHSWGSVLGLRLASEIPEQLHAYIGMGQLVDGARNETRSYEVAVERAQAAGDRRALAALAGVTPPYLDGSGEQVIKDLALQRKWLERLGGVYHDYRTLGNKQIIGAMLKSTEYGLTDFITMEKRGRAAARTTWREQLAVDFFNTVPRLETPVWFFMGEADYNTPVDLVYEYYGRLDAPAGKAFVRFEKSGHFPIFEEFGKFRTELLRVVEATEIGRAHV